MRKLILFLRMFRRLWSRGSGFQLSAEAAYYMIMGIAPFIIFFVNILMFCMASQLDYVMQVVHSLPADISAMLDGNIRRVVTARSSIWMFGSLVVALYTSAQGIEVLVRASDIETYQSSGIVPWLMLKAKSYAFTIGLVVSFIFTLGLPVFGNALIYALDDWLNIPPFILMIWDLIKYTIPFLTLVMLLCCFYHFAPMHYMPHWTDSLLVAFIVSLLWLAATLIYSWLMLLIPTMGAAYGSMVGVFTLFLWIRYIALAIVLGSQCLLAWHKAALYIKKL